MIRFSNISEIIIIFVTICFCSGCVSIDESLQKKDTAQSGLICVSDSTNQTLSFSHPVERIVTIDAQSPEILILLGAQDSVVGMKDSDTISGLWKQFPHAQVVGKTNPDYEKIATLHPDVVIVNSMMDTDNSIATRIRMLNVPVLSLETYGAGMTKSISTIGKITGKDANAEKYLSFYQKYDNFVIGRVQNVSQDKKPLVYWEQSYGTSYVTVGPGSGAYSYLKKLNVRNVAGNLTVASPRISPEWLITQDPEIIIKSGGVIEYYEIVHRPELSNISAVRNHHVYSVNTTLLYGPRDVIGRLYLAKIFYPDLFEDINPDRILDQYSEVFVVGANTTYPVYPSVPGTV